MSLEGQQFGEFEILERLGQGGMGAVYKARQVSLRRMVALKTLQAGIADDVEYIERFHQEARAAAGLNHPNLVQVYSAGENEGLNWFAMEYVEGESARVRMKRYGRVEPLEAIAIVMHVATALEYGWRKAGLIHRDIKPDNIFLSQDGEVKLGDLGLAKSVGQTTGLTVTGHSMGTPYYISPEQVEDMKEVDFRADIYSLGCTLFHMLSGKPPFDGTSASSIMVKHITQPVPRLIEAWPECPPVLDAVVGKTMQKAASERQQSYAEVLEDLRQAYEMVSMPTEVRAGMDLAAAASGGEGMAEPAVATPGPSVTELERLAEAPVSGVSRSVKAATPGKSKLPLFVGVAAALVVLVAGFAIFKIKGNLAKVGKVGKEPTGSSGQGIIIADDFGQEAAEALARHRIAASSAVVGKWMDALAEPAGLVMTDAAIEAGGLRTHGTVETKRHFVDGAARLTATFTKPYPRVFLRTRLLYERSFGARINDEGQLETLVYDHFIHTAISKQVWPLAHPVQPGEDYTLEMQCAGSKVSVVVNGETVTSLNDEAPMSGACAVEARDAEAVIKKFEYRVDAEPDARAAALLETGAIPLWSSPGTTPPGPNRSWDGDALKLDQGSLFFDTMHGANAIVRAAIRMNPEAKAPRLGLRRTQRGGYFLRVEMSGKPGVELYRSIDGHDEAGHDWPLPRAYGRDEFVHLELRAVGDELRVSADGQVLGTLKDKMIPEAGGVFVGAEARGYFRDIVYVPLDRLDAHAAAAWLETGAMRLWDTVAKIRPMGGISAENGALKLAGNNKTLTEKPSRDGILRAMVNLPAGASGLGMSLRFVRGEPGGGACQVHYSRTDQQFIVRVLAGGKSTVVATWQSPRDFGPEDWFEVELRAVGDALTVTVDGQVLGTVRSALFMGKGYPNVYSNSTGLFRDVVYVPLD